MMQKSVRRVTVAWAVVYGLDLASVVVAMVQQGAQIDILKALLITLYESAPLVLGLMALRRVPELVRSLSLEDGGAAGLDIVAAGILLLGVYWLEGGLVGLTFGTVFWGGPAIYRVWISLMLATAVAKLGFGIFLVFPAERCGQCADPWRWRESIVESRSARLEDLALPGGGGEFGKEGGWMTSTRRAWGMKELFRALTLIFSKSWRSRLNGQPLPFTAGDSAGTADVPETLASPLGR